MPTLQMHRRDWLRTMLAPAAVFGFGALTSKELRAAPISPNDAIKVTKIEAFVLKSSWVFVKISTDAGITGWGEMLKDDAKACAAGARIPFSKVRRLICIGFNYSSQFLASA